MKEKVLEAFKALGFEMKELEIGYGFQFEGNHYLYLPNENNEHLLNIALPVVYEFDDDNELESYRLMDKVNSDILYVKAYRIRDDMWLFYERYLSGEENFERLLPEMIYGLEAAFYYLKKSANNTADDDELDVDEDATDDLDLDDLFDDPDFFGITDYDDDKLFRDDDDDNDGAGKNSDGEVA